jgi:signal transduction histidine kinase
LRKDGTRFFASGLVMPLLGGESPGFVKIARDQTTRLEAEKSVQEKEMLRRLVVAQEDERRRVARDLHDHLGQQLTSLRLKIESLKKIAEEKTVYRDLEQVEAIAEQLDRDVDFLAWELRPASLDDLGLRITLANFVKQWSDYTGVKAEFHQAGLGKNLLNFEIETNLYRIAQEALNNIYKHAKAKNVSVLLEKRGKLVSLIVEDDGVGFNVEAKSNRRKGLGLVGMHERARICGGTLEIESAKDKGTTIYARVPAKR